MDVTAGYRVSKRFSVIATLPITMNRFSMLFPPRGPDLGQRHSWLSSGVGDLSIYGQRLLFDPKTHPFGNIALGLGMKLPTGNWNLKAHIPDETGLNYRRRAVYPAAIMPGDGGVGVLVGFSAYKMPRKPGFLRSFTFSASANYLINPAATNGTQSIVSTLGVPLTPNFLNRLTNSVTDSYDVGLGVSWRPPYVWDKPWLKGLRFNAIGKCEGVPKHDLIGSSRGFRQPGYSMSIGPGVSYTHGKDTILVETPIVFARFIDPGESALPGLPVRGRPAPFNPNRQMGLVAPAAVSVRYIRSF